MPPEEAAHRHSKALAEAASYEQNQHMYKFTIKNTPIKTSSEFLNGLVMAYREGHPGAAEALVDAFEPLISKYFRLLVDGSWDIDDKDVLSFLHMISKRRPEQAATNISESMSRVCEPADVHQELVLVLLETALRYVNVSSNYRFVVREHVTRMLGESIIFDRLDEDVDLESLYHFIEIGAIDTAWVNGLTAGDGFDQLTVVQRAILKYIYEDGLAVSVAAKKLKLSVRHLQRLKSSAETALADHFHIGKD